MDTEIGRPGSTAVGTDRRADPRRLGTDDGAHRNSPLLLTEIPQVSQPVAMPV
jgi:hypothetical protein